MVVWFPKPNQERIWEVVYCAEEEDGQQIYRTSTWTWALIHQSVTWSNKHGCWKFPWKKMHPLAAGLGIVWGTFLSSWRALSSCDLLECSPPEDPNLSPLYTSFIKRGNCSCWDSVFTTFPLTDTGEDIYRLYLFLKDWANIIYWLFFSGFHIHNKLFNTYTSLGGFFLLDFFM